MKVGPPLLLLLALLAGCSKPAVPEGIPESATGEALPTVHGFVVDETIRPLAGAEVRFLGTDIKAFTDEDGAYRIFEPVDEAYAALVTAFKPGYWPRTAHVQVSGHVSARLDFGLALNQYLVPHTAADEHRGFARCDAKVRMGAQGYDHDCQGMERNERSGEVPGWMWEINPTPGFAGAVIQVAWNPAWPDTERLHLWLVAPMAGGQGGQVIEDVTAASPVRFEVGEEFARAMADWTSIRLHVDLPESGGSVPVATAAFGRDQLYEAVATLFYVDPAPPGYVLV